MKFNLDDELFPFPCPSCGKEIKEKIGRLKRNPKIICRGCHTSISIDANKLRRTIDSIQKSFDKLGSN
jgi:transcription elongation factor Elf1